MPLPTETDRIANCYAAFRAEQPGDFGVALATMALLRAAGHDYAAFDATLREADAALTGGAAGTGQSSAARHRLDEALARFRDGYDDDMLLVGLLARADVSLRAGDQPGAAQDLTEVLDIAQRKDLRRHEADALLGFARLSLAAASLPGTREQCLANAIYCWRRAVQIIAETGYDNRHAEAGLIEAEIALVNADEDAALAALGSAARAISAHQQFSLVRQLAALADAFPAFASHIVRLSEERAAFSAALSGDGAPADAGPDPAAPTGASSTLAAEVATVLADPTLRKKTEAMLANPTARAHLERSMAAMTSHSLDELNHQQQVAAMAAFILSHDDDSDEAEDEAHDTEGDDEEDAGEARTPVSGQLGAAVDSILGDSKGRELVDSLLAHPDFRRALVAELEASQVPLVLEQLPHDIQRKFAAAFALEKGVIAMKGGNEPAN